jgi:hypothetical protein
MSRLLVTVSLSTALLNAPLAFATTPAAQNHGGPKSHPATHGGGVKGSKPTTTPKAGGTTPKAGGTAPRAGGTAPEAGDGSAPGSAKKDATAPPQSTAAAAPAAGSTKVQQKLQNNTHLANRLQSRLPAGTDLMAASSRFRNLGQFVAAVNVSNNLGIPFDSLKTKMVDGGLSLGQSIHELKPDASATVEAERAETEAGVLIDESEQAARKTAKPKKSSDE